jgi:hypothetical protein
MRFSKKKSDYENLSKENDAFKEVNQQVNRENHSL